ncbi:MAG TPA: nitric-oxide reductase large subunit [Bryobacteraceae bacterium]|nr:nitric-oxide reductase large subunit [Bryobacteraceae bacterium]
MSPPRRSFDLSSWWFQGAILTYLFGFTVLGIIAYLVYSEQPPMPAQVVSADGRTLFTGEDIQTGMNVFQRAGLMEYGSVYGHGAYLGPDYTADYLHRSAEQMIVAYRKAPPREWSPEEQVRRELHRDTYDPATGILSWSSERAVAHTELVEHYTKTFANPATHAGMGQRWIPNPEDARKLTAFFAWTAWTATTDRPGKGVSYTNNWPPEPLAGNTVTADAMTWSVISIIFLLGGAGVIFYFFGRHDWLGWGAGAQRVALKPPGEFALTPGQRMVFWFLLVASALFLIQTFLGGLIAHYRAEPGGFFGFDVARYIPYNIGRTWHVQLALFWVTACFLAAGIFILPLISRREPKGQGVLAGLLLAAVTVVVLGSLAGEYAGAAGWMGSETWFWFGHQGWEYLDLGRFWQVLLVIGLAFWAVIVYRGLRSTLREEHPARMPWLLFYSALTIPLFYAVGLLASPNKEFVIADFWRFWVVHLWVEDFLELFTTVLVAYMFVLLGMVRVQTATRIIYLDVILYSIGGVIGTMHHLYFSGTPASVMALGATFSAMEVIPLLLLTLEAWGFIHSGERSAIGVHPHRWAVWFLVAVGVWNFFGAGVFGFLINLPVVSYYEIGTNLTANHGHTAMMGVYGMLAVGLLLFCLRYMMEPRYWSDRLAKLSFWSLNIGLAWMAFGNLFPVGIVQLHAAVDRGYWYARSAEFLAQKWVNLMEWSRFPGDAIFIVGGAAPLLLLCLRALQHPNPRRTAPETEVAETLYEPAAEG